MWNSRVCIEHISIFAIYHGEPFLRNIVGRGKWTFCILEICFSQSLSNQHIPKAMKTCVVTFSESITSIHGKLWERLVYLWSTVGGIKKNMNLQQTLFGWYYRISLFSLCTHAFTDIHKNVWKRPLPVEWSCHHSTLIMKCNDLYALAAYST